VGGWGTRAKMLATTKYRAVANCARALTSLYLSNQY